MDNDHLDNLAPRGPDDDTAGDDITLSQPEWDAFRQALPFMYRRFPEIRRVRPDQLDRDDPVRGVLEAFLEEQRGQAEDVLKKPEGGQPT